MSNQVIHIGLNNYVLATRIVAVVNPLSSPMRRLKEEAKSEAVNCRLHSSEQGKLHSPLLNLLPLWSL